MFGNVITIEEITHSLQNKKPDLIALGRELYFHVLVNQIKISLSY